MLFLGACSAGALHLHADIIPFDVSLSPDNEVPPVSSPGSGGEILEGVSYDTDTQILAVKVGYGVDFGFTNLTGPVTMAHIHTGAAGVNGPVLYDFIGSGNHASVDPVNGGVITANVPLVEPAISDLLAGNLYINLHTAQFQGGELRGQLVEQVNTAPTIQCLESMTLECTSHEGTPVDLNVMVEDADGDQLAVTWTVDGTAYPTTIVPSGGETTVAEVPFDALFGLGEHQISISVDDGTADPVLCEFTVTVEDTTPPVIHSITPTADVLWPPNHKMRKVNFVVDAEDACSMNLTTEIVSITSNEDENGLGDGNTPTDWVYAGLRTKLRAERSGNGNDRIYTITINVTDESGNVATGTAEVTVPHDQGGGNSANTPANNNPPAATTPTPNGNARGWWRRFGW